MHQLCRQQGHADFAWLRDLTRDTQPKGKSPYHAGRHCSSITPYMPVEIQCHYDGSFCRRLVRKGKENPNQFTKAHSKSFHLSVKGVHCIMQSISSQQENALNSGKVIHCMISVSRKPYKYYTDGWTICNQALNGKCSQFQFI